MSTAMQASGHQQNDNKGTTGEQEEDSRRTRRGKNKGQKEGNRRTRSGDRLAAVAKLHTRRRTRGQQEDNARTQSSPARPEAVASYFFLRENSNSKLFGGKQQPTITNASLLRCQEVFKGQDPWIFVQHVARIDLRSSEQCGNGFTRW